ncbi:RecF/RecN/SMC protein, partial [Sistotremastrum suecicum HHB10207 ss-3]
PATETPENVGPISRLVIHKLVLVDFKSYAGRQEIGPFHKSFSSIVGPNGSGKSNTIDALLFVFGYRASKMRQGKLSELIHNSARYPDLKECSVEVHFREIIDLPGPHAYEVVPNSRLVVNRTAYKNNSSKYTINGAASSFTEVTTLLKERGIDLDHKRFLILQGEVESIAQMKPKAPTEHEDGLLEYLEDIIGTSKYKQSIEDALVELDRCAEERAEKLNRLRIVEKEKNSLESKKREAENYLRLQNELVRAYSRLYQWSLWQCFTNQKGFQHDIAQLEAELADETERNKDDLAHAEELQVHFDERVAIYEAPEAVKNLSVHEKQEVGLQEKKKHANTKAKKLKKSLQEDEKSRTEALRTIEDSTEQMENQKRKLADFEEQLEREEKVLEGIRDSLKDKTQVFHDQIETKQKDLEPWTAKLNNIRSELNVAQGEHHMLSQKVAAIQASLSLAESTKEAASTERSVEELGGLKESRVAIEAKIKGSERRIKEIQSNVQELRMKLSNATQKIEEARSSQASNNSQNAVLDSLTRLRDSGRIQGFHGRLGNLGTIPEKYDVAVTTACGALNNLVVDKVEQGQACLEHLRSSRTGRATFMILEKLSQQGMDKIQTPENAPRLFDLITPKDPKFAPAFYKALHNTLVADNLDQANRLAFGQRRWRVVTLAGQLIDASGTMSGGGNRVSRGGMSSKLAPDAVSPDQLRQYQRDCDVARQELDAAVSSLRQREAEHEVISKEMPETDMAIRKVELDIATLDSRVAEMDRRIKELKNQNKPDTGDVSRLKALDAKIKSTTAEEEKVAKKTQQIETEIKELEQKILDVGGSRLLSQKSKVEGLKLHISLANDAITKAEVNKSQAEKEVTRMTTAIETNSTELEEVAKVLEDLDEQYAECQTTLQDIRAKVEAAHTASESAKDDLEGIKAELDSQQKVIQKFRAKEMEIQQKLKDRKKESAENEERIRHFQSEHDKLSLEELDDDDDEEMPEEGGETAEPAESLEASETVKQEKANESSYELKLYTAEELKGFRRTDLTANISLLEEQVQNAKPDLSVLKEYRKREADFLKRAKQLEDVTKARDVQKQTYDDLRKRRLDEFMVGFNTISSRLKEMYQMITLGGNAELELVDSMDPFSEGIIFSVMPPKKSWKNISNLSGGEKTLSSLALVFALHVFKPTPLYFMDEIDAALDFRNVSIVANYIKDRTKNAQFIIISLRNDMFELSHRLIGIYKTANATQSISIDNQALTNKPKASQPVLSS